MENDEQTSKVTDPFGQEEAPAYLEDRIAALLKKRELISESSRNRKLIWLKVAASVTLFISLFLGGWWLGKNQDFKGQNASVGIGYQNDKYLLLTYNPADFIANNTQTEEYSQWFQKYSNEGYLELGHDLSDNGWTIETDASHLIRSEKKHISSVKGYVSGFFIIRAPNPQKAYEIACTCPHLKYQGVMELRPVTF